MHSYTSHWYFYISYIICCQNVSPIFLRVDWSLPGPYPYWMWSPRYGIQGLASPWNYFPITTDSVLYIFHCYYVCYWSCKPNYFLGSTCHPGVPFSLNINHQYNVTECQPAPWKIFPLVVYYTTYPIFTRLAKPVIGHVNPIHFEDRLVSPGDPFSLNMKPLIWDRGC